MRSPSRTKRDPALIADVPQRLFAAFGIMIYAPGDEAAHLLISKNKVVSVVQTHAERFACPLDEL